MSTPPGGFYSEERWENWLGRIREEDLDPEDEDSARLLLNLQDDAAIAVAKILKASDSSDLDEAAALDELAEIREIVLTEVDFDDEEDAMLVDGVQTSLVPVFVAAEEFLANGTTAEATPEEYVSAAAEAETEDDPETALGFCAQAGTQIIDGASLDVSIVEDLEYGLVAEWINGLDSLQRALEDPEVVEEEDADE